MSTIIIIQSLPCNTHRPSKLSKQILEPAINIILIHINLRKNQIEINDICVITQHLIHIGHMKKCTSGTLHSTRSSSSLKTEHIFSQKKQTFIRTNLIIVGQELTGTLPVSQRRREHKSLHSGWAQRWTVR